MRDRTAKHIIESGKSATSLAEELGIDINTVCRWVREYRSTDYNKMLTENSIISSMSRTGCPYDNSCVEGFFASLKKEFIYRRKYDTMVEIESDLFEYTGLFYNRKRLHASLNYLSPVQYRIQTKDKNIA